MTKTVLKIDGMMCGMCESHINDCIRKNFSVDKVTTSHSKGQSVILSKEPLDGGQDSLRHCRHRLYAAGRDQRRGGGKEGPVLLPA